MNKNNIAIDYLRAFVIVLVLAFHAVIAYTAFAPPATTAFASEPYLWAPFPIVDSQRWAGFDLFVLFNDTFFMSLMFFLAGLFVWSSIARKGRMAYLRDRCLRLGLPFIAVGILLIPLAYYPSYLVRGADASISAYLQQWISLDSWPSGPCWFIAALLLLDFLTVLVHRIAPGWIQIFGRLCSGAAHRPARFFFGLMAISIITYSTMRFAFDPFRWFTFGPFAIQASRVLGGVNSFV